MNGLLAFTLGLTTNGFISNLGAADARLKGFIGGMVGLGAIVAGVQKAVEKGAGLKQLSDQTGESIGNLYRLQQGFKAVGLDAAGVGNTLFMLNKALGGINDNGEPTAGVFAQMGLSIDGLKKLNAPQQLLSIASALNKLDVSSATSASGKIFGRYNAREFLQLARNADEFADALRKGGVQAATFDRFGRTFEKIENLSGQLKEKLSGIFVGIASGIGPALENVLKMLNNIDLSKIGAGIGTVITAFVEAFREGKLSDIIGDTLKLGFDSLLAYAPGIFIKVGATLLKAFETPLEYIQAGMEYALSRAGDVITKSPWFSMIADGLGVGVADQLRASASGASFDQILAERKKEGVKFDLGSGEFDISGMQQAGNDSLAAGHQKLKGEVSDYLAKIQALAGRAPQPDALQKIAGASKESFGAATTRDHTALEKMGFVFRGGSGSDPNAQTARNTGRMVNLLQNISNKMNGTGSFQDSLAGAPAI